VVTSSGKCSCGKTKVTIYLPETLDQYRPRECDCDFCVSRNISYLSHPDGELAIESKEPLERQHQGSNQADFITCNNCKTVIAAALQLENKLIGALNSTLLLDFALLQKSTVVSPQMLSAKEKVERWQAIWLEIKINGNNHI
jgi:hypothetical protein